MISSKRCPSCKTDKDVKEFGVDKRAKNGIAVYCKSCNRKKSQKQRDRNPDLSRKNHLRYRYGLTLEQTADMLLQQKCKCAICGCEDKRLVIDHCHKTGKVRELLCDPCNQGIGFLRDNINTLENAITYLKKHNEQ